MRGFEQPRAGEVFDQRMAEWRAYKAAPWGRLRFQIVAHTLSTSIARLGGGSWRILDAGGGDGGDALPLAVAGHSVTVLDPSGPMLEALKQDAAGAGVGDRIAGIKGDIDSIAGLDLRDFDLVLCHFVLQYLGDLDGPLAKLVSAVRPGGYLSLIAPNRPGEVLARAARGVDPAAAFALLDSDSNRTQTFDHAVRRIDARKPRSMRWNEPDARRSPALAAASSTIFCPTRRPRPTRPSSPTCSGWNWPSASASRTCGPECSGSWWRARDLSR